MQTVPGFGIYHTGVQIQGVEYFFNGGASGSGVVSYPKI
jgi:hypothetical protein